MKVKLRPFTTEDLDAMIYHANNPKVAANLTDAFPSPYTKESGLLFLERVMKQDPAEVLAIEVDGEVVGNIGIHPQQDVNRLNAELGYFIGEDHWGKGIATEAIKLMVKYAFDHFDLQRIFARPFGTNIASQKVLQKTGFVLEARIPEILIKNGQLEDELFFGIRRKDI
jgi:RimJ/RimL family protein N-acetyltransferase